TGKHSSARARRGAVADESRRTSSRRKRDIRRPAAQVVRVHMRSAARRAPGMSALANHRAPRQGPARAALVITAGPAKKGGGIRTRIDIANGELWARLALGTVSSRHG